MPREKPPTINADHPLQKGSRWIWVPVLTGTLANILFQVAFWYITKGLR